MRFHRIVIEDFRAIGRCVIEPRLNGVTVIEGDNELGKSSIAEALWLVFEQHDDSQSALVRSIRPANRDAASRIAVEVSSGPYRFIYEKQFHRGARTELRVTEPRAEQLFGREAHNRALAILDETTDRALWQALRLPQGAALDALELGQHGSLLGALDAAALSGGIGGDGEQTLFERVQAEFERYYTATGRDRTNKDGDDFQKLRSAVATARDRFEALTNRIESLESDAARCLQIESAASGLAVDQRRLKAEVEALGETHQAWLTLDANVAQLRAEMETAEEKARNAGEARQQRQQSLVRIAARETALAENADRGATYEAPISAAREALESASAAAIEATARLAAARDTERLATDDLGLLQQQLQLSQMDERLERLEETSARRTEIRQWLAACTVDRALLESFGEAEREVARLDTVIEAQGATVELRAPQGLGVTIDGAAEVVGEQPRILQVAGETHVVLPGGIEFVVRAGSAVREVQARRHAAAAGLTAALQAAGVATIAEASAVFEQRLVAENENEALSRQLKADLRDLASAEELASKAERERRRIAAALAQRPSGQAMPASIDEARAARDAAAAHTIAALQAETSARQKLTGAEGLVRTLESERDKANERVASLKAELDAERARLTAARQGASDADLEGSAESLMQQAESARASYLAAAAELTGAVDVSAKLSATRLELQEVEERLRRAEIESARIRAILDEAGANGLHQQRTDAETLLTAATERLESFERRANAARLLFRTLDRLRDQAREAHAGPFRDRVEQFGKVVFGSTFSVELTEDLGIARRTLNGVTLDLHQLSAGAREQLSVIARLACASLVSAEGAPVVLDDILGWADPRRLEKFGRVLPEASEACQVLIFTCTPARFAAVAPARVISLPTGTVTDREATGASPAPISEPPLPPALERQPSRRPVPPAPRAQGAFDLFEVSGPRTN